MIDMVFIFFGKDNDYEVWTESSITYTTTNQQLLILFGFVVEI